MYCCDHKIATYFRRGGQVFFGGQIAFTLTHFPVQLIFQSFIRSVLCGGFQRETARFLIVFQLSSQDKFHCFPFHESLEISEILPIILF